MAVTLKSVVGSTANYPNFVTGVGPGTNDNIRIITPALSNVGQLMDNALEQGATAAGAVQNQWYTIASASDGPGVIFCLDVFADSTTAAQDYQCRFVLDGVTIYQSNSNFWNSGGQDSGVVLVGQDPSSITWKGGPLMLAFKSSFSVEVRCTSAGTSSNFNAHMGYYTI